MLESLLAAVRWSAVRGDTSRTALPASALLVVALCVPSAPQPGQLHSEIHLVVLYDNSNSQRGVLYGPVGPEKVFSERKTTTVRDRVVKALSSNLPVIARLRVMSFGSRVLVSPAWVRTESEIAGAFDDVAQPTGGPSPIWDGLWHASEVLEHTMGLRVAILVTDGRASANVRGFDETLERVRKAGIVVHGVVTISASTSADADGDADPAAAIRTIATESNGRFARRVPTALPDYLTTLLRALPR